MTQQAVTTERTKKAKKPKPKERPIEEKCDTFVQHYLKTLKIKESAIAAGYPESAAHRAGGRLLERPEVREAILKAMEKRAAQAEVDANWVLVRLIRVAERCLQAEAVVDHEGNPTGEYKFDSKGACRALELIGKHIGMFREGRLAQDNGAGGTLPQQHLHVHVGPEGGQLGAVDQRAIPYLPPIREIVVNRKVPQLENSCEPPALASAQQAGDHQPGA
jgi:phage terminase small subunit